MKIKLPDWRNELEYTVLNVQSNHIFEYEETGVVKETHRKRKLDTCQTVTTPTSKPAYAWEFLRRNVEYQDDFQRLCDFPIEKDIVDIYRSWIGFTTKGFNNLPPSLPFHAALYRAITKWGLNDSLPDPNHDLRSIGQVEWMTRTGLDPYRTEKYFDDDGEKIPYDGGVVFDDMQCLWTFDVSLPIKPQIEAATQFLEAAQIREHGKKIPKSKTSPTEYVRYLRLLDAVACGADNETIERVLFQHIEYERYNEKSQQHSKPRGDAMKKSLIAANLLVNGGYSRIA